MGRPDNRRGDGACHGGSHAVGWRLATVANLATVGRIGNDAGYCVLAWRRPAATTPATAGRNHCGATREMGNRIHNWLEKCTPQVRGRLIGGGTFLHLVKAYRCCWLGGRYGGGKTSLAVRIAHDLCAAGVTKRVVANFPIAFGEKSLENVPARDCAVVMDEAGLFWKSTKSFESVSAFMRKMNNVAILPSITPPNIRFRVLSVRRRFNLAAVCGMQIWLYQWKIVAGGEKEQDWFAWMFPDAFDWYDSNYAPADDAGISEWIDDYAKSKVARSFRTTAEKKPSARDWARAERGSLPGPPPGGDGLDTMGEAAEVIAESAERISTTFERGPRRR